MFIKTFWWSFVVGGIGNGNAGKPVIWCENVLQKEGGNYKLRCFDIVFQRPYRYFSIALKVVLSLSDCYKILTSNWLWIEICENVVLSKIDITMTVNNNKKL